MTASSSGSDPREPGHEGSGTRLRFASGLSRHPDPVVAVAEALGTVVESVGQGPDLALLFVSGRVADSFEQAVQTVNALLAPRLLLATTASGVLAGGEEAEADDAVALWAGNPGSVDSLRLDAVPGTTTKIVGLPSEIAPGSTLIVLADPYSFPVDDLIVDLASRVAFDQRPIQLVGGLASLGPGRNRLAVASPDGQVIHSDGAVGLVLSPHTVTAVVSQGCRPIGRPWTITAADGQLILELGGRPALERVNEMINGLNPRDRLCATQGLHLGLVANEQTEHFDRGDFLIRGVLGADRESGAVAVGAIVRPGQTVQFQVRDAESAHDDLVALLARNAGATPPAGALVFTCNGRGSHLFAEPHHDAGLINECTNGRGVAGMFCAGELGPIGPLNAVHGFTATVLLFPATVQPRS